MEMWLHARASLERSGPARQIKATRLPPARAGRNRHHQPEGRMMEKPSSPAPSPACSQPQQHPVPVTPAQMAAQARDAFNAGASIMHVHIRAQEPGMGHMPSWDPDVAREVVDAIRAACPVSSST